MKCSVKILDVQTIHELPQAWTNENFVELLDRLDFQGAADSHPDELRDLVLMAITDFEPEEAAEILLTYKLSDKLSKGQIKNLSNEMMDDKVAEEYSDLSLHEQLYDVNQLLFKAYEGKFPDTKASLINLEMKFESSKPIKITEEIILKVLNPNLGKSNLVKRLFEDQLAGEIPFPEAADILWQIHSNPDGTLTIITSDYWLNDEDMLSYEFGSEVKIS